MAEFTLSSTYLLVLVDDEPVSFSAVRAHIFPGLVKSILEQCPCNPAV